MIVLGIETTAHTFGVGLTDGKRILSNEKDVYKAKAGIIPVEAAKHHREKADEILGKALEKAGVFLEDVDYIAISTGPGLAPCLSEGLKFGKSLGKDIIPVNHCVAHIEIGRFDTGAKDPLTLYVSGGNSQITALEGGRYRVFGETIDIGVGNAIDKFARGLGIPTPAGPVIEEMAKKGKNFIELPYSVKGMDLVFSGVVTAALGKVGKVNNNDLVYSFQETLFSMVTEATERALAHTKKKEVLLAGGVAANKRLQEMLKLMAGHHEASFRFPKLEYCGDNGAMIAWTGYLSKKHNKTADINPRWRTDEVEISWA